MLELFIQGSELASGYLGKASLAQAPKFEIACLTRRLGDTLEAQLWILFGALGGSGRAREGLELMEKWATVATNNEASVPKASNKLGELAGLVSGEVRSH